MFMVLATDGVTGLNKALKHDINDNLLYHMHTMVVHITFITLMANITLK